MVQGKDFIGPRSFERLGRVSEPPPHPPPEVIHISVFDKTLMGKNRVHETNRLLHHVHRNLRAIRFGFPEDVVDELL